MPKCRGQRSGEYIEVVGDADVARVLTCREYRSVWNTEVSGMPRVRDAEVSGIPKW